MKTIEKIKKILVKITENSDRINEINGNTNIIVDIGLDSIQIISFIMEVEAQFDIDIDYDTFDYTHMESVENFCSFILSHK